MQREIPSPIVAVLVVFEGRVLLVRRAEQGWTFPSRPLRWGEPLEESIRRSVAETVGLEVKEVSALDIRERLLTDREGQPRYHYLFLYFTAFPSGGRFRLGHGVEEARWFSPDETWPLGLSRHHRRLIREGTARAPQPPLERGEAA